MNKLSQKGFSPMAIILLIVLVGLVGATGWYVYNSNKNTNKSLDNTQSAANSTTESTKKDTSTTKPTATPTPNIVPTNIPYNFPEEYKNRVEGVVEINNTSEAFQKYLANEIKTSDIKDSNCKAIYSIDSSSNDKKYYIGGLRCVNGGGVAIMWGNIDSTWLSISATQMGWKCTDMQKYEVPQDLYKKCY